MTRLRTILLLVALLALAACGGRARPAQVASPEPTASATADRATSVPSSSTPTGVPIPELTLTPTVAPSPSATASPSAPPPFETETPTPVPSARLANGRWLQSIGDCTSARREFAEVVMADPSPAETAEARYRLAQCYLRDDAYGEAAVVLTQLLATAPESDPYRPAAYFALGETMAALNRPTLAEANYTAFLRLVSELASLGWQRIAAARRMAGDLSGAVEAYTAALKDSPDWQNTVAIRRALADLAVAQKDYRGAVAQYDLLRGGATTGAWSAEMQWLAGSALAEGGDQAEAVKRWQAAVDADPTSGFAHQAVVALLDAGVPVDEYQRGLVNFYQGNYALAIAAFDRMRNVDSAGRGGAAWYYAGLSYLRLGQPGDALGELEGFISAYKDSLLWAKAWLAKAEAQARAGDPDGALATYREFAALRPSAPEAPQALWRAAELEAQNLSPVQAAESYLALGRSYPAANEGPRAYQAAGLAYFRAGDYRRAAEVWAEMAGVEAGAASNGTPGPVVKLPEWTRPQAYYWLGRSQAAAGDREAARRSWQAAWEAGPDTYYGLRAAERLAGENMLKESASPGPESNSGSTRSRPIVAGTEAVALANWLRTWAGEGSLALPAAIRTDPDWRRGEMLLTLGWWTVGLSNWERAQRRYASDPWALAALALAFRDAGANRLSVLCAEQLVARWGHPMREAPPEVRRLAYPFPYADLIRAEADKRHLDPRLVAAMIRQESLFEWTATSGAGAQGLMQLMPATAQWVAMKLAWPDYEASQAYWPYVNVAFGTYYLRVGLDQFDDSLATALAGYNGGPGNAAKWRQEAGGDDDLMTALIRVDETRLYVQTVLVQYEIYKQLYPETEG